MGLYDNENKNYDPYKYKTSSRYKVSFIGGLLWGLLFLVIYGIYKLIEWLFL